MLHYNISGRGKEVLVLLHGFMENSSIWADMEGFLSKDFKLIKVDLPGHGLSEVKSSPQTMEMMADEVKATLDSLNLRAVHLLGHSMGGYVSLAFAEKYPEMLRSLTLFFSTALEDDEEKKKIRTRSIEIIDKYFSMFVNNSIPNLFNPNEKDRLGTKINLAREIALSTDVEGVKAAQLGMVERPNRLSALKDLEAKVLIITGRYDGAVKNELFISSLPERSNIKVYTLDCGHCGHWEKPEVCSAIINQELLNP